MVQAWRQQQDTGDTVSVDLAIESDQADLADINLRVNREPNGTVDVELVGPSSNPTPTLQQREGAGDLELVELDLTFEEAQAHFGYSVDDGQDGIVMKKNMDQEFIVDPNHTRQLVEIGFSHAEAHQALVTSQGDIDVAIDKLLSGNA